MSASRTAPRREFLVPSRRMFGGVELSPLIVGINDHEADKFNAPLVFRGNHARRRLPAETGRADRSTRYYHPMPHLSRDGDVFILNLGNTENRFHPDWLTDVHQHLETVQNTAGPRALVTIADGKFYSNGLDVAWMGANPGQFTQYVTSVQALFARPLTMDVPSVAAIQGHAFGGGAMFAMAHDYRIMRAERGYFCFPEVDMNVPFSQGVSALLQSRLSAKTAHEAMTTSRRYGGEDACLAGIVDAVAPADAVLRVALDTARPLARTAGPTLARIREQLYERALRLLREPVTPADVNGGL